MCTYPEVCLCARCIRRRWFKCLPGCGAGHAVLRTDTGRGPTSPLPRFCPRGQAWSMCDRVRLLCTRAQGDSYTCMRTWPPKVSVCTQLHAGGPCAFVHERTSVCVLGSVSRAVPACWGGVCAFADPPGSRRSCVETGECLRARRPLPPRTCWCCTTLGSWRGRGAWREGGPCTGQIDVKSILNGETGEFSCYFQYTAVSKDVGHKTRPH